MNTNYDPQENMLPCPLCGIKAEVYQISNRKNWGITHPENCPFGSDHNSFYPPRYSSRADAVTAWNTRHELLIPNCIVVIDESKV
jgi:hypothetical protein